MKKTLTVVLSALILLGITGCNKNESTSDTSEASTAAESSDGNVGIESSEITESTSAESNVKTVTESYDADFEICRNTSYINLDWTNASKCPVYPVSELYNIKCKGSMTNNTGMPINEILVKFEEYCNFYFGEYLDEFAGFIPQSNEGEEILPEPPDIIVNGIEYRGHYKISDYKEKLENKTIVFNFLVYKHIEKNQYILWAFDDYPHWINRGGALTVLGDVTTRCSSWLPSDMGKPIARYYNDGKSDDVKYQLTDGEVSIGEAIKYFTEEYPKTLPYEDKPVYSVNYVDVYELGDAYGYLLHVSPLFDSVAFEQMGEMTTGSPIFYYYKDGQALMVKKNDIDTAVDCDPRTKDEREGEPITNIVSLKEAADIVSRKIAQKVMFDVVSTEFVYHGSRDAQGVVHLKPTWRFVLYNENDSKYYNIYVDAESGALNYFGYTLF